MNPCEFKLEYEVAYCCVEMRRLFLELKPNSAVESRPGCVQERMGEDLNSFAKKMADAVGPDFHFTYYQSHLNFKGSYEDQTFELKLVSAQ
jgi:hypothetical protein